jgi:2-methylcitrate dehydratase PrpD
MNVRKPLLTYVVHRRVHPKGYLTLARILVGGVLVLAGVGKLPEKMQFIDVLSDLIKRNGIKYQDIEEVILHFDELRRVVDRGEPKNAEDNRFSTQHILAYQMIYGECNLDACTEASVKDPRLAEAREKVKVVYHPEYPKRYFAGEGRIDLKLKNGKTLTHALDQPYGEPKYPLTMDQVVDIYRKYCKGILSDAQIERTKDIILNLDNEPDIKELVDICTFRHMA